MKFNPRKISFALATGIAITSTTILMDTSKAQAGCWVEWQGLRSRKVCDSAGVRPTNRGNRHRPSLRAKFTICNKMKKNTVNYKVNAKNDSLRPGQCTRWTTTGRAILKFDKYFISGYQGQTYTVGRGNYVFQTVRWNTQTAVGRGGFTGIDLKRS
ncbi:hypothetical protein ACSYAD_32745 [Acaryochloris marina NIES-2412]|uniref:hypothetical protein n=1 Tax=Acaryochloris marina TaxID=155978 RepID=UPI00405882CD